MSRVTRTLTIILKKTHQKWPFYWLFRNEWDNKKWPTFWFISFRNKTLIEYLTLHPTILPLHPRWIPHTLPYDKTYHFTLLEYLLLYPTIIPTTSPYDNTTSPYDNTYHFTHFFFFTLHTFFFHFTHIFFSHFKRRFSGDVVHSYSTNLKLKLICDELFIV